jgi:hypothetical protein
MSNDMNSFTMGPSRVDVDRDFQDQIVQTSTSTAATVTNLIGGVAELKLGTATTASTSGKPVSVRADDGTFFNNVLNGLGKQIAAGDRLVIGRITDAQFAAIGVVSLSGSVSFTTDFSSVSTTNMAPCYPVRVRFDDLGLGLGDDILIYRDFIGNTRCLNLVTGSESTINSIPPDNVNPIVWYGVFDGALFCCTYKQLYRLNVSTSQWSSGLLPQTTTYVMMAGPPIIRLSYMYVCQHDGGSNVSGGMSVGAWPTNISHRVYRFSTNTTYTLGEITVSGRSSGIAGTHAQDNAILWNARIGYDGLMTINTINPATFATTVVASYYTSLPFPHPDALFYGNTINWGDAFSFRIFGDLMGVDPNSNLFFADISPLGGTRVMKVSPNGTLHSPIDDVPETLGYNGFTVLRVYCPEVDVVCLAGYYIHAVSGLQVPIVVRINVANSTAGPAIKTTAEWETLATATSSVVGLQRNLRSSYNSASQIGGDEIYWVGTGDPLAFNKIEFTTL